MRKTTLLMAGLLACLLCAGCAETVLVTNRLWVNPTDKNASADAAFGECRKIADEKTGEFARSKCSRSQKSQIDAYRDQVFVACMKERGFVPQTVSFYKDK